MYDKRIKEEFWTTFGKYMALNPAASGERINWINYKTGVKHVQFRLIADDKMAGISIELTNSDVDARKRLFDQLIADLPLLLQLTDENWQSQLHTTSPEGRSLSRIYQEHKGVNVYFKSDWPAIISFMKFQLVGLDQFWEQQRDLYAYIADR